VDLDKDDEEVRLAWQRNRHQRVLGILSGNFSPLETAFDKLHKLPTGHVRSAGTEKKISLTRLAVTARAYDLPTNSRSVRSTTAIVLPRVDNDKYTLVWRRTNRKVGGRVSGGSWLVNSSA